ncbi:MAG: hypothetical protein RL497_1061 [Pseudomonadota bacterium]
MADNASFLWVLRNRQRREPHVYPEHIAELDGRIQANLDGLLLYGEEAWAIAQANGEFPQGGEAFCLGVLAFSGEDVNKIQYATEFGLQNPDTFKGLASCLAWLPGIKVHPWLTQFFQSKNLDHKRLALAACRIRQEDPAGFLTQILEREDCLSHAPLLAEALRAVGFFKRADLATRATTFLTHADPQVVFWAVYAGLRLGHLSPVEMLKSYCTAEDENLIHLAPRALFMTMCHLPLDTARSWIGEWVEQGLLRTAVQACGFLGDAVALPWLTEEMANPELNRLAGEAFYLITGQQPPRASTPEQDESDDTNLEDNNLPWADSIACSALCSSGNLTITTHFKAQLLNRALGEAFSAMRYQRIAQWLNV